jgi:hypothetical protein
MTTENPNGSGLNKETETQNAGEVLTENAGNENGTGNDSPEIAPLSVTPVEGDIPPANVPFEPHVKGEEPGPSADIEGGEEEMGPELKAAIADFTVESVSGNGAHDPEKEGFSLRLIPTQSEANNKFFLHPPAFIDLQVLRPEVAKIFKQGSSVKLAIGYEK